MTSAKQILKIVRFKWKNGVTYGIANDDIIYSVKGNIYDEFEVGQELCRLSDVKLLAPCEPKTIVGVGGNYYSVLKQTRNQASQEPELFVRPALTVIGPSENIIYPKTSHQVNAGVELAIVIKRRAWEVSESESFDYVLGYTCGIDLTAFDLLEADKMRQARAKSWPTSNPLGPWIVTHLDTRDLGLTARVNGAIVQRGRTTDLVFGFNKLISYISRYIVLAPGDVIMTGQPGTNTVNVGDTIEVEIEKIGSLRNTVVRI
jgi:2-keto-4-pentenoate hydratase/2-oxohepta-3-ene-1,7-dioic acid hydratase in catechol pathway